MHINLHTLFIAATFTAWCAEPATLSVGLKRAVEIALSPEGNAEIQLAGEGLIQAKARTVQARAELLPSLEGTAGVQSVTTNLSAMGFTGEVAGLRIPRGVGPYRVVDARVSVTQNVLDLSSIRHYQSSKAGIRVARNGLAETQDQIASRIARYYLAALRADANLEVTVENVKLADAILRQAEALQSAGTGTGIEVTRARVMLANEKQKQLLAENGVSRARQELLRAMNVRLDTLLDLTDRLAYLPLDDETLPAWKDRAMKNRSDLKAQQEKEAQSKLTLSAHRMERVPSVSAFGDYGALGSGITNSIPTRTYGVSVKVPIFDGGRREGKVSEFTSLHRQEQIRTNHLRDQMELELRLALDAIRSADREVEVAIEGLTQSEKELAQARRRYAVGVANSMEVSDAQTRLAQARDNRVAALFRHSVARIDLADAAGTVQAFVQGEKQ